MPAPLYRRSLKGLQTRLEQALSAGDLRRIHAAAIALAGPASVQGDGGRSALSLVGAAFAGLAGRSDAPAFAALDAALCLRAGVTEDEREQAAALAGEDVPDGPPSAELCARWSLAERWAELAALPEPDLSLAEGPFGAGSGPVALAAWQRARREGLPLGPAEAAASARVEREAWDLARTALRPVYETWEACRANMLWLVLVGQWTDKDPDGALLIRLRRAGWRFWTSRREGEGSPGQVVIEDLDGITDGAPEWVRARVCPSDTKEARTSKRVKLLRWWWGVHEPSGIATWDHGALPLDDVLLAAGSAQQTLEWLVRQGWNVRTDAQAETWTAWHDGQERQAATLAALVDEVRRATAQKHRPA